MDDKLIERLRASRATWEDAKSAPTDLETEAIARILADAAIIKAAEELAEAVVHEREMVCQDVGLQLEASQEVEFTLEAFRAAVEARG